MIAADVSISLPVTDKGRTALRFEGEALSRADLETQIQTAAAVLHGMGVGRGIAFSVLCENRPEVLIAYYAAARLGAVFISINQNLKPAEISYVLAHSDSLLLLHDAAMAEAAAQAVQAEKLRPIELLAGPAPAFNQPPADGGSDFMIAYTSGSTGTPKAVVFDQAAEVAGNAALIEMWGIGPEDRMVVALPLGFLFGLSTASATGLQAGCEVILLRKYHPAKLLDALVSHRATIFHGVPTMYAMMLEYCEQNDIRIDLSFMRLLICAGAPLSAALKARFAERFGKAIDDYYALTEIRPVFGRYAHDTGPLPEGAIGKAAPGTTIRIIDETGADVGDNREGEILVRAASTLLRYHKNPELTQSSLRDGLFVTGDIGYRDSDGYYYLTGRIKDIIIKGGANIAPAEVENVLLQHEAVQAAAVVGKPDRIYGEVPVAFVVLKNSAPGCETSIIEHCKASLADFKVPTELLELPELPLGITGKVDKALLKASLEKKP